MLGWHPIESIPRDGTRVSLLSANKKTDHGYWYDFDGRALGWWTPEVGDDWTGGLCTENGEGDYTHWKPMETIP
jgi:hypothetical protein